MKLIEETGYIIQECLAAARKHECRSSNGAVYHPSYRKCSWVDARCSWCKHLTFQTKKKHLTFERLVCFFFVGQRLVCFSQLFLWMSNVRSYIFSISLRQDFADPQVYEKGTSDLKTLVPNQSEAAAERC